MLFDSVRSVRGKHVAFPVRKIHQAVVLDDKIHVALDKPALDHNRSRLAFRQGRVAMLRIGKEKLHLTKIICTAIKTRDRPPILGRNLDRKSLIHHVGGGRAVAWINRVMSHG